MIRKSLILLCCFFCGVSVIYADALPCSELCSTTGVAQFVFTTPTQTLLPNTLSQPITVQSQNATGGQESIGETFDLSFTSSSQTSHFLSSTGKVISTTMSKGTSNRTFYYLDSALGTYTLTVTATGRTSKKSFSTTQQISVASTLPTKPAPVIIKSSPKSVATVAVKAKVPKVSIVSTSPQVSPTSVLLAPDISSTSATNVATVYEGVKETSMFDSLFDWPRNFWKWLTKVF